MKKNAVAFYGKALCLAALAGLSFTACKKESDKKMTFEVAFGLGVQPEANVSVYATRQDMYNNTNALYKARTSGRFCSMDAGALQANKTYYVDLFTDDYVYHSWFGMLDSFVYADGAHFKVNSGAGNDPQLLRKKLLNGNETNTKWVAVDARYNGNSVWNTWLNDNSRYKKLTIRKDFVVEYTSKDATGAASKVDVRIMNINAPQFTLSNSAYAWTNAANASNDTITVHGYGASNEDYLFIKE